MAKKKKMSVDQMIQETIIVEAQLPFTNWMRCRLEYIVDLERGITFPATAKMNTKGDNLIGCARTANIQEKFIWNDMIYVDNSYWKNNVDKIVRVDDILMSTANSYNLVGKAVFIDKLDEQITFGGFLLGIRTTEVVNPKYLYFYLRKMYYFSELQKMASQTTNIANLNGTKINNIEMVLPPVQEQQRIVNRIESLFEKIDKAQELIEESRDGFEKRKEAILAKAFRGELTAKWREENGSDYLSANTLVELIREETNSKKKKIDNDIDISKSRYDLPETWQWVNIGDVLSITSGGTPSRKKAEYFIGDVPWIKTGEIQWNEIYDSKEKITDEAIVNSSAKHLPEDSVLIAMYGQGLTRGRAAILKTEATCNQAVCAILPNKHILSKYIYYYFMEGYWRFRETAQGGNQPNFSGALIKTFDFPLAPVEEQFEIIKILDHFIEEEKNILQLTNQSEQIDLLKKSILAKAFRGELGTNDPNEDSSLELLKEIFNKKH